MAQSAFFYQNISSENRKRSVNVPKILKSTQSNVVRDPNNKAFSFLTKNKRYRNSDVIFKLFFMYGIVFYPLPSFLQQVQRASRRRCIHPHLPLTLSLSFTPHLKGVLSATKLNDERIWRGWLARRGAARRWCNMHARTGWGAKGALHCTCSHHLPTYLPTLCLYCTESYKIIGLVLRTWSYQPLQCAFYCRCSISNSLLYS